MDDGLRELIEIRLTSIDGQLHELEIVFPLIGYPLTSSRLKGDRVIRGDRSAAKANREAIIPLFAGLRPVIGLPPGRWNVEGEVYFDRPADYEDIKHVLAATPMRS
jgi:hypothetical protein